MAEIVTARTLQCRLCGYVKFLRKDEQEPERCPACHDGKGGMWKYERKPEEDTWTA